MTKYQCMVKFAPTSGGVVEVDAKNREEAMKNAENKPFKIEEGINVIDCHPV